MTHAKEAEKLRGTLNLLTDLQTHRGWELYQQILAQGYNEKLREMQSPQITPDERQYAAGQAEGVQWVYQMLDTSIATLQNQLDVLSTKEADEAEQSNEATES